MVLRVGVAGRKSPQITVGHRPRRRPRRRRRRFVEGDECVDTVLVVARAVFDDALLRACC
jgi:hypothetical protein